MRLENDLTAHVLLRRNEELRAERDTLKRLHDNAMREIFVLRAKLKGAQCSTAK